MIEELGIPDTCVKIYYDGQRVIYLTNHQVYHKRTKHIDICLHFIMDMIEFKENAVDKMATKYNLVDMFIKSFPRSRFMNCLDLIKFIDKWFKFGENNKVDGG